MSTSQYLLGAGELAVIAAALGLGAYYARALIVPGWHGAPARLAEFVLGISALVVIAELLGLIGLLRGGTLVAACAAVGLGVAYWARARAQPAPDSTAPPPAGRAIFIVAVAASFLVVAHWAVPTQESLASGMYYQDTTWYHMSFSARFAQEAQVGPLHFTDPLALTAWFYPQNAELLHAVGMVALKSDFLSPLINLGWLCLALLAAWCIGRPYAVGAATLLGAVVVLDSDMILGSQAGNAPNDIAGLFFLLAVLALLITGYAARSDDGDRGARLAGIGAGPLFLAALAAGLGIGTKITLLAALGVLTIGLILLGGRRGWLKVSAIWLGGMLITAGFWYGRSVLVAANPFPQVGSFGPLNLPGPDQVPEIYPREPHSLSEYYSYPRVWETYLFPTLDNRLGPLWFLVLALVVVALVVVLFQARSWLLRLLAVTGIVAGAAYVFTPLTASGAWGTPNGFDANLRYVAPAMIIALALLPLAPKLRRGRGPTLVMAGFGALFAIGFVTSDRWSSEHLAGALLLAAALVLVPASMALMARRGVSARALAAVSLAAVLILIGLGESQRGSYLEDRYAPSTAPELGGGFRSLPEWLAVQRWGVNTKDSRIAIVGRGAAFGQYVFYGHDLSNYVQYIGKELRRGTFRPINDDCKEWRRTLNAGDYDYLVTTPRFNEPEDNFPLENRWADDPNTEPIVISGPARVYRINGELAPGACGEIARKAERDRAAHERAVEARIRRERRAEVERRSGLLREP